MKLFKLAKCLKLAVPGSYPLFLYTRGLISMIATVTGNEWDTRNDPSRLSKKAALEPVAFRELDCPKTPAMATCPHLDTSSSVERMGALGPIAQELVGKSSSACDDEIDAEYFAYDVTALSVGFLCAGARVTDNTAAVSKQPVRKVALVFYRDMLLVTARGCAQCGTPLPADSQGSSQSSFSIIFCDDANDPLSSADFAVVCNTVKFPMAQERLNLTERLDETLGADFVSTIRELEDKPVIAAERPHRLGELIAIQDPMDALPRPLPLGFPHLDRQKGLIPHAH